MHSVHIQGWIALHKGQSSYVLFRFVFVRMVFFSRILVGLFSEFSKTQRPSFGYRSLFFYHLRFCICCSQSGLGTSPDSRCASSLFHCIIMSRSLLFVHCLESIYVAAATCFSLSPCLTPSISSTWVLVTFESPSVTNKGLVYLSFINVMFENESASPGTSCLVVFQSSSSI